MKINGKEYRKGKKLRDIGIKNVYEGMMLGIHYYPERSHYTPSFLHRIDKIVKTPETVSCMFTRFNFARSVGDDVANPYYVGVAAIPLQNLTIEPHFYYVHWIGENENL